MPVVLPAWEPPEADLISKLFRNLPTTLDALLPRPGLSLLGLRLLSDDADFLPLPLGDVLVLLCELVEELMLKELLASRSRNCGRVGLELLVLLVDLLALLEALGSANAGNAAVDVVEEDLSVDLLDLFFALLVTV